jgi:hypothetical protein
LGGEGRGWGGRERASFAVLVSLSLSFALLTIAVKDKGVHLGDQGGPVLHGRAAHWRGRKGERKTEEGMRR